MSDSYQGPRSLPDPAGDDTVARLLRLAGHRPPVPAEDAALVKAAARAEWQRMVQGHQRRQRQQRTLRAGGWLAAAAVLLAAVGLGLWQWGGSQTEPRVLATLEASTDRITAILEAAGSTITPDVGQELSAGAVLETSGGGETPARAALRLASGPTVRLDVGTRVRLISASVLDLERGGVYVDTGRDATAADGPLDSLIEIRTPLGVARDIGTRFEVRMVADDASLAVNVRDGEVVLERDEASHSAVAGVGLTMHADGTVVESQVPLWGSAWEWTHAILPAFDVEGLSLYDFLGWAAREGGWKLRFADPALIQTAREVVLHGSIDGLSLFEAVELCLLGSGLSHRLEDGVLRIEASS